MAHKSFFFDSLFYWLNKFSIVFFCGVLLYYFFRNRKVFWLAAVATLLGRGIITEAIHYTFFRLRPFVALADVAKLVQQTAQEASFPSGHAAFFFPIALMVYLFDRKIGVILILLALLFSFIRIYAGVHYPGDILGSIVISGLSVYLVYTFRNKLLPKT